MQACLNSSSILDLRVDYSEGMTVTQKSQRQNSPLGFFNATFNVSFRTKYLPGPDSRLSLLVRALLETVISIALILTLVRVAIAEILLEIPEANSEIIHCTIFPQANELSPSVSVQISKHLYIDRSTTDFHARLMWITYYSMDEEPVGLARYCFTSYFYSP